MAKTETMTLTIFGSYDTNPLLCPPVRGFFNLLLLCILYTNPALLPKSN